MRPEEGLSIPGQHTRVRLRVANPPNCHGGNSRPASGQRLASQQPQRMIAATKVTLGPRISPKMWTKRRCELAGDLQKVGSTGQSKFYQVDMSQYFTALLACYSSFRQSHGSHTIAYTSAAAYVHIFSQFASCPRIMFIFLFSETILTICSSFRGSMSGCFCDNVGFTVDDET